MIKNIIIGIVFTIIVVSEIFHQDYYLIVRYSDKYCEQCVNHAISVLLDNKDYFDFPKINIFR